MGGTTGVVPSCLGSLTLMSNDQRSHDHASKATHQSASKEQNTTQRTQPASPAKQPQSTQPQTLAQMRASKGQTVQGQTKGQQSTQDLDDPKGRQRSPKQIAKDKDPRPENPLDMPVQNPAVTSGGQSVARPKYPGTRNT